MVAGKERANKTREITEAQIMEGLIEATGRN